MCLVVRRVLVEPRKAAPVFGPRSLRPYAPLRCVPNESMGETNTRLTAKVYKSSDKSQVTSGNFRLYML